MSCYGISLILLGAPVRTTCGIEIKLIETEIPRIGQHDLANLLHIIVGANLIGYAVVGVTQRGIYVFKKEGVFLGEAFAQFVVARLFGNGFIIDEGDDLIPVRYQIGREPLAQPRPVLRHIGGMVDRFGECGILHHVILHSLRASLGETYIVGVASLRRCVAGKVDGLDGCVGIVAHGVDGAQDGVEFGVVAGIAPVDFRAVHLEDDVGFAAEIEDLLGCALRLHEREVETGRHGSEVEVDHRHLPLLRRATVADGDRVGLYDNLRLSERLGEVDCR